MGKKLLSQEYFKAPPYDVMLDAAPHKGRWQLAFGREAPIHVEIGMGLGHHLVDFALAHPELNHIGLEMKMHRIYTARHKAIRRGARHLRFVPGDANEALAAFAPGELHRLTLLFPDPWTQDKFARKRLTHPDIARVYRDLLDPDGLLHFRTDDPGLYAYSCDSFREVGFSLEQAVPIRRTLTDFENRWLSEGKQIFGFDARPIK